MISGVTGLRDDPASKGRKLTGAFSVGSSPMMLLLSGPSSSEDGVGVRVNRYVPFREVVLFSVGLAS